MLFGKLLMQFKLKYDKYLTTTAKTVVKVKAGSVFVWKEEVSDFVSGTIVTHMSFDNQMFILDGHHFVWDFEIARYNYNKVWNQLVTV